MCLRKLSLLPSGDDDGHLVDDIVGVGAPVASELSEVLRLVEDVHLGGLVVLEGRMVNALLGDVLAAPHEDTLDLLLLLGAENAHSAERPLSEVLPALEVAVEHVLGHEELLALALVHLVVHVPAGPALLVVHLQELVHRRALLVRLVHEERLEVEEVELGGGEELKGGLGLLGGTIIITTGFLLRGHLFRCGLGLLDLDQLGGGVHWLLAHFDLAEDAHELGHRVDLREKSGAVGHAFLETRIEQNEVGSGQAGGDPKISHRDLLVDTHSSVQCFDKIFDGLDAVVVIILRDSLSLAEDHG